MRNVLLLHAGIADSRMWLRQTEALEAAGFHVCAPDLRGFGQRPLEPEPFSYVRDVEETLAGPAAVIGCSLGGRVALELAVHRPELVERIVVIAPGLSGWEWSEQTRAGWAEEEAAFEGGDLEAAAEASLRMWVDGPGRSPEEVDPDVRSSVRAMVLRSYELQQHAWEAGAREDDILDPPLIGRLGEIQCRALVLIGDGDIADMRAIAVHVADSIKDAQLVRVADAAHLPSLERPDLVNGLLLDFLGNG
jgi:3-oxoadipate enol-lactonase